MRVVECAGGIVTNQDGLVLVIKNQIGKTTLPKGTQKPGETPEQTAVREITEESGLAQVKLVKPLGVLVRNGFTATKTDVPSVTKRIHMFHFQTAEQKLGPFADDVVDARWVQPNELKQKLTWPEESGFFEQHRETIGL